MSATAPFADDFSPATEENWRQRVEAALKGGSLQKLVSRTYDGFDIQPLYARAAGKPRAFRAENEWAVTARVDHPDAEAANALALTDLENGANGLHLAFAGSVGAYGFGLKDAAALAPALKNVHLDAGLDAGVWTCRPMPSLLSPPGSIWFPRGVMTPRKSTFPSASTPSARALRAASL